MESEIRPLSLKSVFGPKAVPETAIKTLENRVAYLEKVERRRTQDLEETKKLLDVARSQGIAEAREKDIVQLNETAISSLVDQQRARVQAERQMRASRMAALQNSLHSTARQNALSSTSQRNLIEKSVQDTANRTYDIMKSIHAHRSQESRVKLKAVQEGMFIKRAKNAHTEREKSEQRARIIAEVKSADLQRVKAKKGAVKEELRKAEERKHANRRKVERAHHEANEKRKSEEAARLKELQATVQKLQNRQYLLLDSLKTTNELHESTSKELEKTLKKKISDATSPPHTSAFERDAVPRGKYAHLPLPGPRYTL